MPFNSMLPTEVLREQREAALEFLLGRINYERTPIIPYSQRHLKLDRMRQLLTRLGNPDAGMPIVHVAGTKGKGSTSALIGSVLQSAGYQVGLFSSPHLADIEERFAINGSACSGEDFVALIAQLRPVVQAMDEEAVRQADTSLSPTYFELTTALALMHFAQKCVDVAVLEVGLGGRLDSTNVCQPLVSVITSISFDHTKQLGNTLAQIAAEKAGIIKPGVPVLCGPLAAEPRETIARIAKQHGCRLIESGVDFSFQYEPPSLAERPDAVGKLQFISSHADQELELRNLSLQLVGQHQGANAALALATCLELRRQGWSIPEESIREGLHALTLPGRIEVVHREPTVVLDVAHNVASARALVEALQTSFAAEERVLVLAASRDKDVPGIVRELLPYFKRIFVTQYKNNPRAVPVAKLATIVREEYTKSELERELELFESPEPLDAWRQAAQSVPAELSKSALICVTGSFFIVAELREAFRGGVLQELAT